MPSEVKLSMTVQSHLSDALIEITADPKTAALRLRFIKYLVHHHSNLKEYIDVDKVWAEFLAYEKSKA